MMLSSTMYESLVPFIRDLYRTNDAIPLHAPFFNGNEKRYLSDVIDSTFVSSVGNQVDKFEQLFASFTTGKHAIAVVNGTSALHVSLLLAGVKRDTLVLTQSLTFVATCNAIRYCGAKPAFIDVDVNTAGMCPIKLAQFIDEECEIRNDGKCWHKSSGLVISACFPMHTFGFPLAIAKINSICMKHNIPVVEDAAEAVGSYYDSRHVGSNSEFAIFSFNGNKIITCGGGGIVLSTNKQTAARIKHLTTTAKVDHSWEFVHDEVGYNYRLPNLNAALGVAQLEMLPLFLRNKIKTAKAYFEWGAENSVSFLAPSDGTDPNYWLNCMLVRDSNEKNQILELTNKHKIASRPCWTPMHLLEVNRDAVSTELQNTEELFDTIICLPSGIRGWAL